MFFSAQISVKQKAKNPLLQVPQDCYMISRASQLLGGSTNGFGLRTKSVQKPGKMVE